MSFKLSLQLFLKMQNIIKYVNSYPVSSAQLLKRTA